MQFYPRSLCDTEGSRKIFALLRVYKAKHNVPSGNAACKLIHPVLLAALVRFSVEEGAVKGINIIAVGKVLVHKLGGEDKAESNILRKQHLSNQ